VQCLRCPPPPTTTSFTRRSPVSFPFFLAPPILCSSLVYIVRRNACGGETKAVLCIAAATLRFSRFRTPPSRRLVCSACQIPSALPSLRVSSCSGTPLATRKQLCLSHRVQGSDSIVFCGTVQRHRCSELSTNKKKQSLLPIRDINPRRTAPFFSLTFSLLGVCSCSSVFPAVSLLHRSTWRHGNHKRAPSGSWQAI